MKKKFYESKEKWHNDNCYIKRVPSETTDSIEDWGKSLFSLRPIKANELIASFSSDSISVDKHYLSHSLQPNCYIQGRNIFANVDIQTESELTIYYHGVLL